MKRLVSAGIVAMVLMVLVGLYAVGPVVSCETELPKACLEAVERQSKGVYSPKLPLIPVRISVTGYEEETVFYTIRYFPCGTVEMSYRAGDGYNIEKPLTRL